MVQGIRQSEDSQPKDTVHPVTSDPATFDLSLQTMVLASGGQDGAICLWDVLTGSRVSHMFAHRGDVTSLTCTTSCVISSGLDDLISIWDRSTGIKLYSIQQVDARTPTPTPTKNHPSIFLTWTLNPPSPCL